MILSWIRKALARAPRPVSRKPARPRKAVLAVEGLEERLVLSTLQVTSLADDGGPGELRQAIANASSGDTIQFSVPANSTIHLQSPLTLSKDVTIQGPGAGSLTIQRDSGASAFRLFTVASGTTATISGLTLSGGDAGSTNPGGAILDQGTLTLTSCTVTGNKASLGGGGGVYCQGTLTVTDCTFSNNSCGIALGGAILNQGTATVTGSTFSGNHSGFNGGGIQNAGTLTVSDSTFSGNLADEDGGGLDAGGTTTVTACTFNGNVADNGGKGGSGGGIRLSSGTLTLDSTLVAGNTNAGTKAADDIVGTVATASSFNLVGVGTGLKGISNADSNHNQVGTAASPLDPKLGPLQNNSGPTFTMIPANGSPAIAAGDPALAGNDQTGRARAIHGRVDVGAFEVPSNALVDVRITGLPSEGSPEGTAVNLGSTVSDIDPTDSLTYSWQATDHTTGKVVASGTGTSLTFTPAQPEILNVSLTVTNAFKESVVKTTTLTVNDVAPTVNLGGTAVTLTGLDLSQSGSFTDPGINTWTATVDYGDGSGSQTLTLNADKTFSLSHHYTKGGTFTVSVKVDDGFKPGSASLAVTVPAPLQGVPLTGAPSASSPEGTALTLGSTVSDLDPGARLTYQWQVTQGGTSVASGSSSSLQFTPPVAGAYAVKLTVTDQNGASVSAQTTITVSNVAPAVTLGGVTMQGVDLASGGLFTDPGADTWTATVDYGDGSGSQPLTLNADKTFTLAHTYAAGGVYTVTVDVSDGSAHGTAQTSVTAQTAVVPPANILQVAHDFTHQDENFRNFIKGAYQKYLGRLPDQAGLDAWAAAMETQGLSDERLEAGFIGSDEYIALHGGQGAGWVTGMYQDLLGHAPSDQEVNGWVNALNNGVSPSQVAYGFAASAEREGQRVQANYKTYLGRLASDAEASGWINAFTGGQITNEDMQAGFMASVEYYNGPLKGRGTNPDWVASIYQDVLHRAGSADEVNTWAAKLG
jgi:hypothetical protein